MLVAPDSNAGVPGHDEVRDVTEVLPRVIKSLGKRRTIKASPAADTTVDKVLVGHSYDGSVIAQAAAGRTDVLALVYTAAFVLRTGSRSSTWRGVSAAGRHSSRDTSASSLRLFASPILIRLCSETWP